MSKEMSLKRVVLIVGLVLGCLYAVYQFFWVPWQQAETRITELTAKIDSRTTLIQKIRREQPKLEHLRLVSLPSDTNLLTAKPNPTPFDRDEALRRTHDLYASYLRDLGTQMGLEQFHARASGVPDMKTPPPLPNNTPSYIVLSVQADGKGKLASVIGLLAELQKTPLLHRVKKIALKREGESGKGKKVNDLITVNLTMDALIVNSPSRRGTNLVGIDNRLVVLDLISALRRGPVGFATLGWATGPTGPRAQALRAQPNASRSYSDIIKHNIFTGPVQPPDIIEQWETKVATKKEKDPEPRKLEDLLSYTRLTSIVRPSSGPAKADLWDLSRNEWLGVQEGTSIPLLRDADHRVVIFGQVARIVDTRYLIFKVQLGSESASSGAKRYPSDKTLYRPHKEDLDKLVKDKKASAAEAERVYAVPVKYWDTLKRDKVVRLGMGDFTFKSDLIRGKIVHSDDRLVYVRLEEKYCGFRDEGGTVRAGPHLGYCYLYNGNKLTDGLQLPVPESEVQKEIVSFTSRTP